MVHLLVINVGDPLYFWGIGFLIFAEKGSFFFLGSYGLSSSFEVASSSKTSSIPDLSTKDQGLLVRQNIPCTSIYIPNNGESNGKEHGMESGNMGPMGVSQNIPYTILTMDPNN